LQSQVVNAGTLEEYERAFARLKIDVNGVLLLADPSNDAYADKIAELAQQYRLPTAFQLRNNVAAGGLMSYGADNNDQFHLAAFYVDRILRGEKPADLPVQMPTKFYLAINLKTAKALGITVPSTLLSIADEVIEWAHFAALHFVGYWHKADMPGAFSNVRFGGKPDIGRISGMSAYDRYC